jgi:hypothetical protein
MEDDKMMMEDTKPRWMDEYGPDGVKWVELYYNRLDTYPWNWIDIPLSPDARGWEYRYQVFRGNTEGTMIVTDHSPLIPYLEKANALTRTLIKELRYGGSANKVFAGKEMWVVSYDQLLQCTAEFNEDWKLRNRLAQKVGVTRREDPQ